jgi:hypothetical protein
MIMNRELEEIWKAAAVIHFKTACQNLPAEREEAKKILQISSIQATI